MAYRSQKTSAGGHKRSQSGLDTEEPEPLNDLIEKLRDEDYVKENLRPDDHKLTFEQEEFVMYLDLPPLENKENQRLMKNFMMEDHAIYFIKYRSEEKDAQATEHI